MKLKIPKKIQYGLMALMAAINIALVFVLLHGPISNTEIFDSNFDFSSIENKNLDFRQLNNYFTELAEEKGGEFAYHALTFATNQNILTPNTDSHLLGHAVGDILYKQEGIEGIKVCTDDLRNACAHSVVVGSLLDNGTEVLPEIVQLCKQAPGGRGAYLMCVHGLGHGVLAYAEYDYEKAIKICEKTGTQEHNNMEVGQCVGGMTMEMVAGVHDRELWEKQYPKVFSNDDPLAPCNKNFVPEKSKGFCYTYLTPRFLQLAGTSLNNPDPDYFPKAMSYCALIPKSSIADRDTCFGSFGKEFAVIANNRNIQSMSKMSDEQLLKIQNWCRASGIESLRPCVATAMQSLYWGGENDPEVSVRFCSLISESAESEKCMNSIIGAVQYYKAYDRPAKEYFCGLVPNQYKKPCNERLLR